MKIDIFATTRFDHVTQSFGIYDDPNFPEKPSNIVPFDDGVVKVENINKWDIYFVPIDKNFTCYKPNTKDIESQCDVLLISIRPLKKYDLHFVELKEMRKNWITGGKEQLKKTILNFQNSYSLSCISKKCAFLANKKHPSFHYNHKSTMEKFRSETGFRLNICATIPIK
ncbi:hypothetical protein FACS1894162_5850 [Bacteroidia bacterium]|nr:hypothetical protein FACS1894162_5850 [Bacteroidia bacterium]